MCLRYLDRGQLVGFAATSANSFAVDVKKNSQTNSKWNVWQSLGRIWILNQYCAIRVNVKPWDIVSNFQKFCGNILMAPWSVKKGQIGVYKKRAKLNNHGFWFFGLDADVLKRSVAILNCSTKLSDFGTLLETVKFFVTFYYCCLFGLSFINERFQSTNDQA